MHNNIHFSIILSQVKSVTVSILTESGRLNKSGYIESNHKK